MEGGLHVRSFRSTVAPPPRPVPRPAGARRRARPDGGAGLLAGAQRVGVLQLQPLRHRHQRRHLRHAADRAAAGPAHHRAPRRRAVRVVARRQADRVQEPPQRQQRAVRHEPRRQRPDPADELVPRQRGPARLVARRHPPALPADAGQPDRPGRRHLADRRGPGRAERAPGPRAHGRRALPVLLAGRHEDPVPRRPGPHRPLGRRGAVRHERRRDGRRAAHAQTTSSTPRRRSRPTARGSPSRAPATAATRSPSTST